MEDYSVSLLDIAKQRDVATKGSSIFQYFTVDTDSSLSRPGADRYATAGAAWFNGAFSKVAKAGQAAGLIPGWHSMSYFSDVKNLCWFLDPESAKQVFRLHKAVGNAVTEGRHIVVGTGLSQLLLAALFALSPKDGPEPMSVVSTCPYYLVLGGRSSNVHAKTDQTVRH